MPYLTMITLVDFHISIRIFVFVLTFHIPIEKMRIKCLLHLDVGYGWQDRFLNEAGNLMF